jgi:hypothetical protein
MEEGVTGRRLVPVTAAEALRLVASVPVGQIVFSYRALPAIEVAGHVVDDDDIVIRCHGRPPVISPACARVVVAYEAM